MPLVLSLLPLIFLLAAVFYVAAGRLLKLSQDASRDWILVALNLGFLLAIFFWSAFDASSLRWYLRLRNSSVSALLFLTIAGLQYSLLCRYKYSYAFWLPIGVLIFVKIPALIHSLGITDVPLVRIGVPLLGISYLTFKLSYSAVELKYGKAMLPSFPRFLNYALFIPTLFIGPINPLSIQSQPVVNSTEWASHLLRIVVGLLKLVCITGLLDRIGFDALIVHAASPASIDYFIAPATNFLKIYMNFSGACDVVIGTSALMGIPVKENFNHPLSARNVREFWSRWHISLSDYFRDIVFSPLTGWLSMKFGSQHVNHAVAINLMVIFLLIGAWHGSGINTIFLGLVHGVAVVFNHYTAIYSKKLLGKKYKLIHHHPVTKGLSIALTFAFISVTALLLTYDVQTFFKTFFKINSIILGRL